MTSYPIISDTEATNYLLLPRDAEKDIPAPQIVGEGEHLDLGFATSLRGDLDQIRGSATFKDPMRPRDPRGSQFEAIAAPLVHAAIGSIDRRILGDPGFWVWLGITHMSDVIDWRYASGSEHARVRNYGVAAPKEGLLFRLWLRGDYLYDPTATDPYAFAKLGDQDLWRSHIFRQEFAKPIARVLVRLQAGKTDIEPLTNKQIRELAKELHRVGASFQYETLSDNQAESLVFRTIAKIG